MADIAAGASVELIVALATMAKNCIEDAIVYLEQIENLRSRLIVVVTLTSQWKACSSSHRSTAFESLCNALRDAYKCIQAASFEESRSGICQSTLCWDAPRLLSEIKVAEQRLDRAMNDFQFHQNVSIMDSIHQQSETMKQCFDRLLAETKANGRSRLTTVQKLDQLEIEDGVTVKQKYDSVVKSLNSAQRKQKFQYSKKDLDSLKVNNRKLKVGEVYLGYGRFADVKGGRYRGREVAVKILKTPDPSEKDIKKLEEEVVMMRRCSDHPNVSLILGFGRQWPRSNKRPFIVMERMHATIDDVLYKEKYKGMLDKLSDPRLFYLMRGIADALMFLHLQNIIHHDVKPANILLDEGLSVAKLADFGAAKVKGLECITASAQTSIMSNETNRSARHVVPGTENYQAPEILGGQVLESSRSGDMYAFGVTLWESLQRQPPHKGVLNLKEKAATNPERREFPELKFTDSDNEEGLPDERFHWRLVMKKEATLCLSISRTERPKASEVVEKWRKMELPREEIPTKTPRANRKRCHCWCYVLVAKVMLVTALLMVFVILPRFTGDDPVVSPGEPSSIRSRSPAVATQNGEEREFPSFSPTHTPTYNALAPFWSLQPTGSMTARPTEISTQRPSGIEAPTLDPTVPPSKKPTLSPTELPMLEPRATPGPTSSPTKTPTPQPTTRPTGRPTNEPSRFPTHSLIPPLTPIPTRGPTNQPTRSPTQTPTKQPTESPTQPPTRAPTREPTNQPTKGPTQTPTKQPTGSPTQPPTRAPTRGPTYQPTKGPTQTPTKQPTGSPTRPPTRAPTRKPTNQPTKGPTQTPTKQPTGSPTRPPTRAPTREPTNEPTRRPTGAPTIDYAQAVKAFINSISNSSGEIRYPVAPGTASPEEKALQWLIEIDQFRFSQTMDRVAFGCNNGMPSLPFSFSLPARGPIRMAGWVETNVLGTE